ncbi:hypothetical protein LCGC14_0232640 [marine sediment metagenome]|uniref:Polynucleotide kinase PNKP phosphatase domain-containing protein n=1 Tax=marine sediment metagenome TaxID=412755 RepID=A0A0F9XEE5_9ZZZZ
MSETKGVTIHPPGTKFAVLCDIDGTLANIDHRRHFIDRYCPNCPRERRTVWVLDEVRGRICTTCESKLTKADWKSFFAGMKDDVVCYPVANILHACKALGFKIVLVTARYEEHKAVTEDWLKRNYVEYDDLYMRCDGDSRKDVLVKKDMLALIRAAYLIHFVIDDRQQMVDMWREEGLTCFQVADGNY